MAQNYECASLDSLPVRVARQLLLSGTMQLRTAEQDDPDQSQIQMSQSDLAAMVGASRQSVNRVLQQLREKHVIEISYLPKYAGNLDIMAAAASRTAYGTVGTAFGPEAAAGGPLAAVRDGDLIELSVPQRLLRLHVSAEELVARLTKWKAPTAPLESGYWRLHVDHVLQADEGCDLDFLVGPRGAFVPRNNHRTLRMGARRPATAHPLKARKSTRAALSR